MQSLKDFIIAESKIEDAEDKIVESAQVNEGEVKSEKDFKEYAKNKYKEVFGDEVDEDKMNKVIDGIISKCDGDWGEAVGMLNKSFAPKNENAEDGNESQIDEAQIDEARNKTYTYVELFQNAPDGYYVNMNDEGDDGQLMGYIKKDNVVYCINDKSVSRDVNTAIADVQGVMAEDMLLELLSNKNTYLVKLDGTMEDDEFAADGLNGMEECEVTCIINGTQMPWTKIAKNIKEAI